MSFEKELPPNKYEYICFKCGQHSFSKKRWEELPNHNCIKCNSYPIFYAPETVLYLSYKEQLEYYKRISRIGHIPCLEENHRNTEELSEKITGIQKNFQILIKMNKKLQTIISYAIFSFSFIYLFVYTADKAIIHQSYILLLMSIIFLGIPTSITLLIIIAYIKEGEKIFHDRN